MKNREILQVIKSLEILYAKPNGAEIIRIALAVGDNVPNNLEDIQREWTADKPINQQTLKKILNDAVLRNNIDVGNLKSTYISYILVDGTCIFDRSKENAKYISLCADVDKQLMKSLTIVDLSGKILLNESYDEKHPVSKDKEKILLLANRADCILGLDLSTDLKANGISLPNDRKYLEQSEYYELATGETVIGKTKKEKWVSMAKNCYDSKIGEAFTQSLAYMLSYDFCKEIAPNWGKGQEIESDVRKIIKTPEEICSSMTNSFLNS